ncbi:hypothetical protein KCU76_g65, partial [Aureobasidium melanogenum]
MTLSLEICFYLGEIRSAKEQFQSFFFDFLFSGCAISTHCFYAFGVKVWFCLGGVFVFEAHVAFFGQQHTGMVHFLKLQFDGARIHVGNCFCDFVADDEGFFSTAAFEVDEEGICIAVDDFGTPFRD